MTLERGAAPSPRACGPTPAILDDLLAVHVVQGVDGFDFAGDVMVRDKVKAETTHQVFSLPDREPEAVDVRLEGHQLP